MAPTPPPTPDQLADDTDTDTTDAVDALPPVHGADMFVNLADFID